jgi:signal peptidase I
MQRASFIILVVMATLLSGCGGKSVTVVVTTPSSAKANQLFPERVYRVPSGSMEPTLSIGARVIVSSGVPRVGEIVVFHPPEGAEQEECGSGTRINPGGSSCDQAGSAESSIKFIKRIVAGPGDTIKIVEGHVIRNGKREPDSYIRQCPGVSECNFPVPISIPAGQWFLMGDNRGESDDSRFWGPVSASWIIGVVEVATPAGSPE